MTRRGTRSPALARADRGRELVNVKASKAAGKIFAAEKATKAAKLAKDADAFERALIRKLDAQRDFAAEYRRLFPHGVNLEYRGDDSTVVSSTAAEFCIAYTFNVRTVQRWCELLDAATYTRKKNEIFRRCWKLAEFWQAANFSSESVDWYTPSLYIDAVREVLGEIDLDPASSAQANVTVGAKRIFTKDDDGLDHEWRGRVFMNPPYGKTRDGGSLAAAFCDKALDEYNAGRVEACIILVNSLHSQSWQAPLYDHPFCLVDHRIQFVSADGEQNKNPTFQNMFVYLGRDLGKFASAFSRLGYCVHKIEGAPR